MSKKKNCAYHRLDKAERVAIERGLKNGHSCRQIAHDLGRAASTICMEVDRNRVVARGKNKGQLVEKLPDDACPRLLFWPHVCNGCNQRHYNCSRSFKCEYCAELAQKRSKDVSRESRMGVDMNEEDFLKIMEIVRKDTARGISPEQIVMTRGDDVRVSVATLYRWIVDARQNPSVDAKAVWRPRIYP